MASQAAGAMSEGPASTAAEDVPLVGSAGQEFVQANLSTNAPAIAIADIQSRAALRDPRTRPLLEMLDQMGLPRA